jgi:hypothetical protein
MESMESQETGFPPFPHPLEISLGFHTFPPLSTAASKVVRPTTCTTANPPDWQIDFSCQEMTTKTILVAAAVSDLPSDSAPRRNASSGSHFTKENCL